MESFSKERVTSGRSSLRRPPLWREKQMCSAPLIFPRRVGGIDSIAEGHWTIDFAVLFSLICKGILKMTISHPSGAR